MSEATDYARRFAAIFDGNPRKYGIYHLDAPKTDDRGKTTGSAQTIHDDVLPEHYAAHLAGNPIEPADDVSSLGILPLIPAGKTGRCGFAVIDVDVYGEGFDVLLDRHLPKIRKLYADGRAIVPAESKSGALHLYVFGLGVTTGAGTLKLLEALRDHFGLPADGTDLRPESATLKGECPGGWINLPYWKGTERCAYHPDTGEKLTLAEFCELVESFKGNCWVDSDEPPAREMAPARRQIPVVDVSDDGPWSDAPPCVQHAMTVMPVGEGQRNDWLAKAAAVYARLVDTAPDDERQGEALLYELSAGTEPPIDDTERDRIWASYEGSGYKYSCGHPALRVRCNRGKCLGRKYGVNVAHGLAPIGETALQTLIDSGDVKPKTTDVRIAETLTHWLDGRLKYVAERDEWLTLHPGAGWLGSYGSHTLHLMLTTVGKLFDELHEEIVQTNNAPGDDHPLAHLEGVVKTVAGKLLNRPGRANIVTAMEQQPEFRTSITQWNLDPHAIGAPDGNWDIRDGRRLPDDVLISKRIGVPFADVAGAAEPTAFLNTLDIGLRGDDDLKRYVQKVLGAGLLGVLTREFCVLWGKDGFNGKSFVTKCVTHVLGDYAVTLPRETILQTGRRQSSKDKARADLALLEGARLYLVNELEPGDKIDEGLVKMLTGSDAITYRRQYDREYQLVQPRGKLVLVTNYMPTLETYDKPIVKRTKIVPYLGQIPDELDRGPAFIDEAKVQEAPGVLAWLVDGARAFLAEGIKAPRAVEQTVARFVNDNDPVRDFALQSGYVRKGAAPGHMDHLKGCKRSAVFQVFRMWCALEGLKPKLGSRAFYQQFEAAVDVEPVKIVEYLYPGVWFSAEALDNFHVSPDGRVFNAGSQRMNGGPDE